MSFGVRMEIVLMLVTGVMVSPTAGTLQMRWIVVRYLTLCTVMETEYYQAVLWTSGHVQTGPVSHLP